MKKWIPWNWFKDDADQEGVAATFKNGVLTVTMPRKAAPQPHVQQIEIQSA